MQTYIEEFLNHLSGEKNCSSHTLRAYGSDLRQFADVENISDISDISRANIRSYLTKIKDYGMVAKTRNRKLASVRAFCKFLYTERYLESNPAIDLECAKVESRLPVTFSEEVTAQVIESAEDDSRNRAMLELLYALGVRVSELVTLKVKDFDFSDKLVKVFGKNSKERIIPIHDLAISMVKVYMSEYGITEPNQYLFPSSVNEGSHLSSKAAYNVVRKYANMNGVSNLSPHKFRHSYATHMHSHGMDIRNIQELLGHSDISTTTIYTKVVRETLSTSYQQSHPRA